MSTQVPRITLNNGVELLTAQESAAVVGLGTGKPGGPASGAITVENLGRAIPEA